MKTAVLVLGSVSSGTRLTTKIFTANGFFGDDDHAQRIDDMNSPKELLGEERIVWRRSLPHGKVPKFPDISQLFAKLERLGFDKGNICIVVTVRHFDYMFQSAINNHELGENAYWNPAQCYAEIFKYILENKVAYTIVSYEALLQNPKETQNTLIKVLTGEDAKEFITIVDGNAKYL